MKKVIGLELNLHMQIEIIMGKKVEVQMEEVEMLME